MREETIEKNIIIEKHNKKIQNRMSRWKKINKMMKKILALRH